MTSVGPTETDAGPGRECSGGEQSSRHDRVVVGMRHVWLRPDLGSDKRQNLSPSHAASSKKDYLFAKPDEARKALRATAMQFGNFVRPRNQEIEAKQDMKVDKWMNDAISKELAKAPKDEDSDRDEPIKTTSSPNSFSDDGTSSTDELHDLESASSSEDESEEESDFHKAGLRPAQRS